MAIFLIAGFDGVARACLVLRLRPAMRDSAQDDGGGEGTVPPSGTATEGATLSRARLHCEKKLNILLVSIVQIDRLSPLRFIAWRHFCLCGGSANHLF